MPGSAEGVQHQGHLPRWELPGDYSRGFLELGHRRAEDRG